MGPMDLATFPPGFVWGTATASYQIEGAVEADGRRPSIWDTFAHTPGRVANGDTGDVACDHYHRWREDVALMAELGVGAYRFSVAWPRVQPDGTGPANPAGLGFYDQLVDALLDHGIEPYVTLYHWDLPQALQDAGGWPARDTAARFADYAALVYTALHDRVPRWATLNEPWCSAFLGHGAGYHAPGESDPARALAAAHHLLLGHGWALQALRAIDPAPDLGIVLNLEPIHPATPEEADADAARRVDGALNRWFTAPLLHGRYPEDRLADLGPLADGLGPADDLAVVATPIDLLGVNFYRPSWVRVLGPDEGRRRPTPFVGCDDVVPAGTGRPRTDMGWEVEPSGLTELLLRLDREHADLPPIVITENGAAYDDPPGADGRIHDDRRIAYLAGHLHALHRAMTAGVDVRGYFVWTLMDNFEWAEGYAKRFGLVQVDHATQRRMPRDSFGWYRDVIASATVPTLPG